MDVNALGGDADLAGVLESPHDELGGNLLDVDVRADDGGVVASQFERDSLESLGAGGHDLLSGGNGAGEGDLGDVWVCGEHGSKVVVTTNGLDDTWWEDALSEFDELEGGVWSVWRGLHDDGVSSEEGWDDLAHRQDNWEVPWANGTNNTERSVSGDDGLLVILSALFRDGQAVVPVEPARNAHRLQLRDLLWLSSLLAKQARHLVGVCEQDLLVLAEQLLSLLKWSVLPGLESLLGVGHGLVDIFLASDGYRPVLLASGRVDSEVLVFTSAKLAVDDVVELVPLDAAVFRHDCGCFDVQRNIGMGEPNSEEGRNKYIDLPHSKAILYPSTLGNAPVVMDWGNSVSQQCSAVGGRREPRMSCWWNEVRSVPSTRS